MQKIIINSEKHGRHEILIDDDDFDLVSNHNWYINKYKNAFYACTRVKKTTKLMHRLILGLIDPKIFCDHINHNGLDNQKINLRSCSNSDNMKNRTGYGKSKYLGVCINKRGLFQAEININKKKVYLGVFKTEEEAAKAYDFEANKSYGHFANLNFK